MNSLKILLVPFALVYGMLAWIRNMLFTFNILPGKRFNVPVISVGNLNVGGTGKSPHVEMLIRILSEKMEKSDLATLSRGYGRMSKGFAFVNKNSASTDSGDEPLQFKLKFPELNVAVDKSRVGGIKRIVLEKMGIKAIILDDAFQHRWVEPGINILLTAYDDLYINDFLLPVGKLRESKAGARRADVIIITRCVKGLSPLEKRALKDSLNPRPYQLVLFSHIIYDSCVSVFNPKVKVDHKDFGNKDVLLVTGIAHHDGIVNYCSDNFKSLKHIRFQDHHYYNSNDIKRIRKLFDNIVSEDKLILTTEKDWMRFRNPIIAKETEGLPLYYLPIEVRMMSEDEQELKNKLFDYVGRN